MPTARNKRAATNSVVRLVEQVASLSLIQGSCTIWTWAPDGLCMEAHYGCHPNPWPQKPGQEEAEDVCKKGGVVNSKTVPGTVLLPYCRDGERIGVMSLNSQKEGEEISVLAEIFCALIKGAISLKKEEIP